MTVRGRGTLCTSPEVCSPLREIFVYVCERNVRDRQTEKNKQACNRTRQFLDLEVQLCIIVFNWKTGTLINLKSLQSVQVLL